MEHNENHAEFRISHAHRHKSNYSHLQDQETCYISYLTTFGVLIKESKDKKNYLSYLVL